MQQEKSDDKELELNPQSFSQNDTHDITSPLKDDGVSLTKENGKSCTSPYQREGDCSGQITGQISLIQNDVADVKMNNSTEGSVEEETEVLSLTLTQSDLFKDDLSVNLTKNEAPTAIKVSQTEINDLSKKTNVKESSPHPTLKRHDVEPKNIDTKRVKVDENIENDEHASIARQIKKMNLEYVKLTFIQKVDQLQRAIEQRLSNVTTSTLFQWIRQLNDVMYIREQSIGNTDRGLVHQLIASKLCLMNSSIEADRIDPEGITKKLDEVKNLFKQEDSKVLKDRKGLLFEKTEITIDGPLKPDPKTWQASLFQKEIIFLKETIEKEERTFFSLQKKLRKQVPRTFPVHPNKEFIDQHLRGSGNAWEGFHYRSWHAKSFDTRTDRKNDVSKLNENLQRKSDHKSALHNQRTKRLEERTSFSNQPRTMPPLSREAGFGFEARSCRAQIALNGEQSRFLNARCTDSGPTETRPLCVCCGSSSHETLVLCPTFFQLDLRERCNVVRKSGVLVCIICLQNHDSRTCSKPSICSTKGCQEKVHSLLHKCFISTESDRHEKEHPRPSCICCKIRDHSLEACSKFLDLDKEGRYYYVYSSPIKVCRSCLEYDHDVSLCKVKRSCVINTHCSSVNHPLIHRCEIDYSSSTLTQRAPSSSDLPEDTHFLDLRLFYKMKLRARMQDPSLCDDMIEAWTCQRLDEKELARMVEKFQPSSFAELQSAMQKKLESGPALSYSHKVPLFDVAFDTAEYFFRRSCQDHRVTF